MEVTIGEEVAEVTWPAVGDDHLFDLDFGAGSVGDGSEWFLVWRVKDVPFSIVLVVETGGAIGMVLEM